MLGLWQLLLGSDGPQCLASLGVIQESEAVSDKSQIWGTIAMLHHIDCVLKNLHPVDEREVAIMAQCDC